MWQHSKSVQSPVLLTWRSAVHLSKDSPSTSLDPIHSILKILLFLLRQNETEQIRPKNISGILNKNILHFTVKCLNTAKHCQRQICIDFTNTIYSRSQYLGFLEYYLLPCIWITQVYIQGDQKVSVHLTITVQ